MSDRETVLEIVKQLPPDVSLREILRKLEFIAAVREGFEEIEQGRGIPVEQVEQMVESWITK
jgi:predicted transcriptional regulator